MQDDARKIENGARRVVLVLSLLVSFCNSFGDRTLVAR